MTRFATDPVPAEPSPESVRLLKRVSGGRKLMERGTGRFGLWGMRMSTRLIARRARTPEGGTAKDVEYEGGVRGRYAAGRDADPANGILMWVHGGGLVSGTPRLEQPLALLYAAEARVPVFLPSYRFAPEHPFPAAADDVLAAYRSLLAQGYPAGKIRVAASSAGGALVAGLLGDLRREELPAAVVLTSPLLDMSCETMLARDAEVRDPMTPPSAVLRWNKLYAGETPFSHPRMDYLGADMTGRPPTLIQVGGLEHLTTASEQYGAAMTAAGAPCEVQIWPGMAHGFFGLGYEKVPEAKAAVAYGAKFIATCGA